MTPRGYRFAIEWMIDNDDNEWCFDAEPIPSVTAAIVADIYGKETEDVTRDLRRKIESRWPR